MSTHYIHIHSAYSYDCAHQLDILILAVEEVLKWICLLGARLPVCRYQRRYWRGWNAAMGTIMRGVEPVVAISGWWGIPDSDGRQNGHLIRGGRTRRAWL